MKPDYVAMFDREVSRTQLTIISAIISAHILFFGAIVIAGTLLK